MSAAISIHTHAGLNARDDASYSAGTAAVLRSDGVATS